MSVVPKRRGLQVAALVAILIIGVISFVAVYIGPSLCIGCPTTLVYNPQGSTHTLKTVSITGSLSTQTLTGGSPSWPIGSAGSTFTISNPPFASFGTWLVTLPSDASTGTSTSYVFQQSVSGTAFLTAANNAGLWAAESPSLNGQNPVTFSNTFTSSVPGTACNTASTANVCSVTWYLNRYYATVDMKTAGAGLSISCYSTCQSYSSIPLICSQCNKAQYDAAFQSGFQTMLTAMNSAAHLSTGTSLSLQVNTPPLPGGQSNVDWAGIVAVWTGTACTGGSGTPSAGGTAVGDLCTTGCGSPTAGANSGCAISQSTVHTPLTLWKDAGLTQPYLPNFSPYVGVQSYTAAQLASLTPASILPSAYTKIDISDFGAGFSQGSQYSNCGISSFSSCWSVSQPEAVLTILVDILSSTHTFQQYPTPSPQTGTSAGSIDGQVVDGSLPWHPGIAGSQICLNSISGCATADSNGNFLLSNIQAGTYSVTVTAPSFFPQGPITVNVGTGTTAHLGQISLAPQNPWYSGNWCIVPPAYPGAFSVCIPFIIIFTVIGAFVLVIGVVAFVYSRPADTATKLARRLTPNNPLSPTARGFVSRRIAFYLNEGEPAKVAQARAFSDARQAGYHVPPAPKTKTK